MVTSLTVIRPASATGISRRMISPISRFKSSRTRCNLSEGMRLLLAGSELLHHALDRVTFNRVARLKIPEAVHADAAFHAHPHFVDFVLKPAQRLGHAFVDQP